MSAIEGQKIILLSLDLGHYLKYGVLYINIHNKVGIANYWMYITQAVSWIHIFCILWCRHRIITVLWQHYYIDLYHFGPSIQKQIFPVWSNWFRGYKVIKNHVKFTTKSLTKSARSWALNSKMVKWCGQVGALLF